MKTLKYFAFAAALAAVSCAEDTIAPVVDQTQEIVFTAANESNFTKTQLVENQDGGASIEWLATDKISVFDAAGSNC
jgi:hypothetical protein